MMASPLLPSQTSPAALVSRRARGMRIGLWSRCARAFIGRSIVVGLAALLILAAPLLRGARDAVAMVSLAAQRPLLRIALTREEGQNGKLRQLLIDRQTELPAEIELVELPCIEHGPGPDVDALSRLLQAVVNAGSNIEAMPIQSVVLTSPEAARVFLKAWRRAAGEEATLPIPVACVGPGTSAVVKAAGAAEATFEPEGAANAEALAAELPEDFGRVVLYPASVLAQTTLQDGLAARGFTVERLDTYTTQAVQSFTEDHVALMATTDIATFGSPSAVKAWSKQLEMQFGGKPPSKVVCAACIGGTSRKAAEAAGPQIFDRVYAPEQPGMVGWAQAVVDAVRERLVTSGELQSV